MAFSDKLKIFVKENAKQNGHFKKTLKISIIELIDYKKKKKCKR